MHGKAVAREQRLKSELQAARAKLKELRQRLRERWARRRGSEKRTRSAGTEAAAAAPRLRGQQPGAPGHGRREHRHLPVQVEAHDVEPERRRCPACGDEYGAHGSEDSEQLEIEVRAYRRVIKRRRYRRSCQCAAAPALLTAAAAPRLIPKGILGISIWVTVLIDKYLLYRPTYRLLADLRAHGLDLAQGTVTDGLRRLAPLFAPLREALIARSRTAAHWHADETRWQVFEASSEDACQRWCLWVFWCREAVVFKLDRTRSARVPKEHFAGVAGGIVSVDRYSSYKRLAKDTPLELQYCWAHVRRDFIRVAEKWDEHREWGEQWLELIGELYHLNAVRLPVCNDPVQWAAADAALRAAVTAMAQRLERELAQPKLHQVRKKVLTSLRNHWSGLIRFVDQPAIPMDNNQAERALRGPVVGRKNYYGSGATWSGELTATLFSLFHTLELWQINPRTWLTEYLNACAAAGSRVPEDFERFLPWNRRDGQAPRASPALPAPPRAAPRRAA
jgi:transposase